MTEPLPPCDQRQQQVERPRAEGDWCIFREQAAIRWLHFKASEPV